jgi:hypothetical protein
MTLWLPTPSPLILAQIMRILKSSRRIVFYNIIYEDNLTLVFGLPSFICGINKV